MCTKLSSCSSWNFRNCSWFFSILFFKIFCWNIITVWCQFLLDHKVHQLSVYIHPLPFEPSPRPIPALWVLTKQGLSSLIILQLPRSVRCHCHSMVPLTLPFPPPSCVHLLFSKPASLFLYLSHIIHQKILLTLSPKLSPINPLLVSFAPTIVLQGSQPLSYACSPRWTVSHNLLRFQGHKLDHPISLLKIILQVPITERKIKNLIIDYHDLWPLPTFQTAFLYWLHNLLFLKHWLFFFFFSFSCQTYPYLWASYSLC